VWSARHFTLLGYEPNQVEPGLASMLARIHPDDRGSVESRIIAAVEGKSSYHVVFRTLAPDGSVTWCDGRGQFHPVAGRAAGRITGVVMDISDHKLAEQRQRLMLQELHHRVKNTLATVQAIASLTRGHYQDVETYHESLVNRIAALSKTHTMLLASNWQRIGIRELLANELNGYAQGHNDERVALRGPAIDLPSDFALTFGLVVHELVTNAAKYGSLSVPEGRLDIGWSVTPAERDATNLKFDWRESRGPAVEHPSRRGFGSILLERLFARGSGSALAIDYAPTGVEIRISSKLSACPAPRE
jgi:PAS domain S-box-containing protein